MELLTGRVQDKDCPALAAIGVGKDRSEPATLRRAGKHMGGSSHRQRPLNPLMELLDLVSSDCHDGGFPSHGCTSVKNPGAGCAGSENTAPMRRQLLQELLQPVPNFQGGIDHLASFPLGVG